MQILSDLAQKVNHDVASNAIFPVNAECAEFLNEHPLPPELLPAARYALSLDPKTLVRIFAACAANGFPAATCSSLIVSAAMLLHNDEPARCMACFTWSDSPHYAVDSNGSGRVATLCKRCADIICDGRATQEMERNLQGYGIGVAS